jgi:putative transposase
VTYNFHMSDFKPHQNRKSLRLPNYEYTQEGAYFITILTVNRECLFGDVVQGEIRLNPIGNIVKDVWQSIPIHFPQASVDDFVIMPNHIHGIINLVGARHEVSSL